MKTLKFVLITLIIVSITGIMPFLLYKTTTNTELFLDEVDGTQLKGIAGYFVKIAIDENATLEIKQNAANMLQSSTNILKYKNASYNKLVIYLSLVLNIFTISLGIILKKINSKKLLGNSFIVAGILSLLFSIFILITTVLNIVI